LYGENFSLQKKKRHTVWLGLFSEMPLQPNSMAFFFDPSKKTPYSLAGPFSETSLQPNSMAFFSTLQKKLPHTVWLGLFSETTPQPNSMAFFCKGRKKTPYSLAGTFFNFFPQPNLLGRHFRKAPPAKLYGVFFSFSKKKRHTVWLGLFSTFSPKTPYSLAGPFFNFFFKNAIQFGWDFFNFFLKNPSQICMGKKDIEFFQNTQKHKNSKCVQNTDRRPPAHFIIFDGPNVDAESHIVVFTISKR
jgi:hypothetical protein